MPNEDRSRGISPRSMPGAGLLTVCGYRPGTKIMLLRNLNDVRPYLLRSRSIRRFRCMYLTMS